MKFLSLLGHHVLSLLFFLAGAQGQKAAAPPAASSPAANTAMVGDFLPLTPDRKAAVRELQYNIQKNEIRVQQLQVEIDEVTIRNLREINSLRQQQVEWNADLSVIATDFASISHLDRTAWDLDQVRLGLVKKNLPPPPAAQLSDTKKPAK
jgi:hypothetical protein